MKSFKQVAVVGVGLIGASIGLALKRRGCVGQLVGVGRHAGRLRKAQKLGAVDRTTTDLAAGVAAAELTVICTPVDTIVQFARLAAEASPPGALITDAGSTKSTIVAALDQNLGPAARFIGSHPLAGDHRAGCEHARADLFDGRTVVVTPTRRSRQDDVTRLCEFWTATGAKTIQMTASEHDRALAATSHVPHAVASALAAATPEQYLELAATGWLDSTRVAAGDPAMWTQIFLSNRAGSLAGLRRVERQLGAFVQALEAENAKKIESLLAKGKANRDAVGS